MRFFALLDFQHWVLAFFLGLVAVIVIVVAWGSYPRRGKDEPALEEGEETVTLENGIALGSRPMPPLLGLLYVLIIAWVVGYLLIEGILGGTHMNVAKQTEQGTSLRTILVALGLSLFLLVWGLFLFVAIGDKGTPSWSFGALDDVPGLSPYSTAGPQEAPRLVPSAVLPPGQPRGQHVMGPRKQELKHKGGTP